MVNPLDVESRVLWGEILRGAGMHRKAIEKFKEAISIDSSCSNILFESARVLHNNNNNKDTILYLSEASIINPQDVESRVFWGEVLRETGSHTKAIEKFKEAIKINRSSSNMLFKSARILHNKRKSKDAIFYLEEASIINPLDAESRVLWGEVLRETGSHTEAIKKFKEAIKINRSSSNMLFESARILHNKRNSKNALLYLEASIVDPQDSKSRVLWGETLRETGDHTGAIEKFKEAISIDSSCFKILLKSALVLHDKRQNNEAIIYLEEANIINPIDAGLKVLCHEVLQKIDYHGIYTEQLEEEINSMEKYRYSEKKIKDHDEKKMEKLAYLKIKSIMYPNNAKLKLFLGRMLQEDGNHSKAIEKFKDAISIDKNYLKIFYESALYFYDALQIKDAILYLREASIVDPQDCESSVLWGKALRETGNHTGAIEKFKEAIKINPSYSNMFFKSACFLFYNNQSKEAIICLKEAIAINLHDAYLKVFVREIQRRPADSKARENFLWRWISNGKAFSIILLVISLLLFCLIDHIAII